MTSVVVGIDGSDGARRALRWAGDEARLRGCGLHVVHVYAPPTLADPHLAPLAMSPDTGTATRLAHEERVWRAEHAQQVERTAEQLLARTVDEVLRDHAEVPLVLDTVADTRPARALIERSRDAALLVVGSRGRGGFRGLLLGSVSQQCVHHARCPVVVVHGDEDPPE